MTQREEFEQALRDMKIDIYHSLELNDSGNGYKDMHTTILFAGFRIGREAAKAQAVPDASTSIRNTMPSGYMLNTLIKFQKWRIGEDERTLDETGLTPRLITLAIDWAIEQLDKPVVKAFPQWVPVSDPPKEIGRYWCYIEEQNDLGVSHYQWNCCWNGDEWSGEGLTGFVTHYMPLPSAPEQNK